MSRKLRSIRGVPTFNHAPGEPTSWHQDGYYAVIEGEPVHFHGLDLPPLWRWFDRAEPLLGDKIARLFCHCGNGPLGLVWRVSQPGAETVAKIAYTQRSAPGPVERQAVLHLGDAGCQHDRRLLLHLDDHLEVHCSARHDLVLPGATVVDLVRRAGGWADDTPEEPPRPRRVVLYSDSTTPG